MDDYDYDLIPTKPGYGADVVAAADRDAVQAQARTVLALVAQLEAACDELSTLAYDLVPDEVALGNLLETVPEFDALRAELRRLRDNGDEFETEDEREQRQRDGRLTRDEYEWRRECDETERGLNAQFARDAALDCNWRD
jgi:hypothetical protein